MIPRVSLARRCLVVDGLADRRTDPSVNISVYTGPNKLATVRFKVLSKMSNVADDEARTIRYPEDLCGMGKLPRWSWSIPTR
jgi:hypothetical protein